MKKLISISEIVAAIRVEDEACEVWAIADANYDEAKSRLEVKLDSFVRRSSDNKHLLASWLPGTETVNEAVAFEEGSPAAKEIFQNWVKQIRRAVQQKRFAVAAVSSA